MTVTSNVIGNRTAVEIERSRLVDELPDSALIHANDEPRSTVEVGAAPPRTVVN
jgi:hypothetical protein